MVYLIHFDKPLKHAQHYIGYTHDLDQRFHAHSCTNDGSSSYTLSGMQVLASRWSMSGQTETVAWSGT